MGTQAAVLRSPTDEEIQDALNRVLCSAAFRASKRCKDFTEYVCLKTLQGAAATLKERTLAIDVFNRHTHGEDSGDENIVRVGAREVRKRLAIYYASEGANDPVRIEVPIGSYVPTFHYQLEPLDIPKAELALVPEPARTNPTAVPPTGGGRWYRSTMWLVLSMLVSIAVATAWITSRPTTEFLAFWNPAFLSSTPLLVLSHPVVYQPSSRALLLDEEMNGAPKLPVQRAINVPAKLLDGSDFVPVVNEYVGIGDATTALDIYSLFAQHSRKPRLQLADKLEFEDLYGSPAILVGGSFSNRWTAELTKNLRYQFRFEGESKPWIVDSQGKQKWGLANLTDDRRTAEDYSLICRIPHAQTGSFLLIVAGLTVFGTEAGGKVLTDPKLLQPVLRDLSKDWADHNLEMVMRVEVIGDGPALPKLVAAYTW